MIKFIDFTDGNSTPFGSDLGRRTFANLHGHICDLPEKSLIEISLEGIEYTDVTFPRESIMSLVEMYKGKRFFILDNSHAPALSANWDCAAKAKDVIITVRTKNTIEYIGSKLSSSNKELLNFVYTFGEVGTVETAAKFTLSVANASTRLKRLVAEGLIQRIVEPSVSGGLEYRYKALVA